MAELTVPRLDFSSLGELPDVYRQAKTQAAREMTLAQLGQSGPINYSDAARKLFAAGLTKEGMSLAQLGNNERDYTFRQDEARRAQGNTDRSFGLQERQLAATNAERAAARDLQRQQFAWQQEQGNRPEIREVTDANGNKNLVLVDRKANSARPIETPGLPAEPNNPFLVGGGKMNEGQSNAALYANRAMEAERILSQAGISGAGGSLAERGRANVPVFGNMLASENYQKFDQARRDFTAAILRKESGAAIGKEEYANADKQYFPQPGDSASVIEQKRRNRINAIRGIGAAAGSGYRPSMVIDDQGNVVERGKTKQANSSSNIPPPPPGFVIGN